MNMLRTLSPANDDGICANILEQISRVSRAQIDAEKASACCSNDDYERVHFAKLDEVIELRRMLWNAGIDPDVFGRAFQ